MAPLRQVTFVMLSRACDLLFSTVFFISPVFFFFFSVLPDLVRELSFIKDELKQVFAGFQGSSRRNPSGVQDKDGLASAELVQCSSFDNYKCSKT